MPLSRHTLDDNVCRVVVAAPRPAIAALTALCGLIGALAPAAVTPTAWAQDAVLSEPGPAAESPPAAPKPPPGPVKVLSWNVGSSPYAIAMRKIKSSPPPWRTSFGSERRTIDAPPPPQANLIDADIVLLQGIINPRALRRLFPARKWRLIFSRRALETLPKGSVFTAPVSSVEVEAVAVRYRDGLRVVNRGESIADPSPVAPPLPASNAPPTPPAENAQSPGLAVQVIDRGRTVWLASVTLDATCGEGQSGCTKSALLARWRAARHEARQDVIAGGRLRGDADATLCQTQLIEVDSAAANALHRIAKGESRNVLGCVAELTIE